MTRRKEGERRKLHVSDVSDECVGKRRTFNGYAARDKISRKLRAHADYFYEGFKWDSFHLKNYFALCLIN